ncbi:D-glycero-alpha-D-manno-heptose-7-phosphate kinase [uncultured Gammaproteobacteria bacterium]
MFNFARGSSYYERFSGFVISAAIDKYVYVAINRTFVNGYCIKYSKNEYVDTLDEIKHPLLREALRLSEVPPPLEVISIADVPAGTGLGSSGAFLVGLLHALYSHKRQLVSAEKLARDAVEIEINRLGEPIGKQDHYIAAYGGVTCQEYHTDGSVTVYPLRISDQTNRELHENLMMFFTGYNRNASDILNDQKVRSELGNSEMLENLHSIKDLGFQIKAVLENGDTQAFGEMMHEHWHHKMKRSTGISNSRINDAYDHGRLHGAIGGKLVGAGGGGFLLFYTRDRMRLRRAMAEIGMPEMPFRLDFDGSVMLLRG